MLGLSNVGSLEVIYGMSGTYHTTFRHIAEVLARGSLCTL